MALSRVSSMMESGGQSVALEENQAQILFTSDNLFFFFILYFAQNTIWKKKKKKKFKVILDFLE